MYKQKRTKCTNKNKKQRKKTKEFKEKNKAKERGMNWDNTQKLWYFTFTRKSDDINVEDMFNIMKNDEDTYFKFKVVKVRCIKMNREDINRFERLCNDKFIEMFNKQNNNKQNNKKQKS